MDRINNQQLNVNDKELNIQRFIRDNEKNGKTFEEIKQILSKSPYFIKISEKGSLALFKYSQLNSDFSEPICCECRGLILEKGTWKVVRYAFDKFFNIHESHAAEIDWKSAVGTEKIDGSLISLYYYDGKWNAATNGTIDVYDAPLSKAQETDEFRTFGDVWDEAVKQSGLDYSRLSISCTYTFELVSPYSKVILNYDKPEIYHIGTRSNLTFEECNANIGVEKPKEYKFYSKKEYIDFVLKYMGNNHEGLVVRDKYFNRVKIKTEMYVLMSHEMHTLVDSRGKMNIVKAVDLVRKNEQSEFLSYFPQYKEYFVKVEKELNRVNGTVCEINQYVSEWKAQNPAFTKKDFSSFVEKEIKDKELVSLYYSALNDKLNKYVKSMETKQLVRKFHIIIE